jgi:hypothetical protein
MVQILSFLVLFIAGIMINLTTMLHINRHYFISHMSLRFWTNSSSSSDFGTKRRTLSGYIVVYVGQEHKRL